MLAGKYYITAEGDPYYNMALDEWAFGKIQTDSRGCPAMLRLYTWNRGAITFGYNQKFEKAIDTALLEDEVPIIRRVTGGRAIFHDPTELTFSLIMNIDLLPGEKRSLGATNALISDALVAVLKRLGNPVSWLDQSDPDFIGGINGRMKSCFGSVSKYEIIAGVSKIAGGAQRRVGDSLIHQGSIKINGISACPAVGQEPLEVTSGSNKQKMFYTISDFASIFGEVFGEIFGITFEPSDFFADELEEIGNLRVSLIEKCFEKR